MVSLWDPPVHQRTSSNVRAIDRVAEVSAETQVSFFQDINRSRAADLWVVRLGRNVGSERVSMVMAGGNMHYI